MEYFLFFLVFPILFPIVARTTFFKKQTVKNGYWSSITHELSILEVLAIFAITTLLCSIVWATGSYTETADYEILNGKVTSKSKDRVGCRHSYPCRCRNVCYGSGKSRSCSTQCDTCYVHTHDFDWNVHTTLGGYSINTIDSQGLKEPPRWTQVNVNDPVSKTHTYTNYIKAAPDSLFSKIEYSKNKWVELIPEYPIKIYDYYKVNRVLSVQPLKNISEWNSYLSDSLKDLGPKKQVNAIIVITPADKKYADAIKYRWLGGKKNDVILVIGSHDDKIEWTEVISWSKKNIFHVELRDAIDKIGTISDHKVIIDTMAAQIDKNFERMEMKDYEYLKYNIEPPMWAIVLCLIISIGGTMGLTWLFYRKVN